jgi:nickel-dependent lactate racemase
MRVGIDYGFEHHDYEVAESRLVVCHRQPMAPALTDLGAAVRAALETPIGFPALRRALTPDDHVAIVVDEHLPHLTELLVPVLEHVMEAGVALQAITLLCPPRTAEHHWRNELPVHLRQVIVETHDPKDRKRLSYLAATRKGRRLYLNRTAVDADQIVVLTRRGYDPLLGYAGSEGALYPALSDDATRHEYAARLSTNVPGEEPWPARHEAGEVAWLLGAPFMIQVIEGAGNEIVNVLGGLADSSAAGQRLLDTRWRVSLAERPETVVAGVSGDPAHHDFNDLAHALAAAARVVKSNGRVVLLTQANPGLGLGADMLRRTEDLEAALVLLRKETPDDFEAAFLWANSVREATVYLLSGLPGEIAEELNTTPLENAAQVQRLLNEEGTCAFLPDAHKTMAVLSE